MSGANRGSAFLLGAALAALPAAGWAGLLTPQGVAVRDATNAERNSFSSNEKLTLQARVNNAAASTDYIRFRFAVMNPGGTQVFYHQGNAVPGRVGNAASQVAGIPVARFYSGPGVYTFKAQATLDGATVEQQATFTVSSPNIILLYPPNGAQGVSDRPLTFRWSSSGATRYRLTVGDSPSLYNAVFSQETGGGETFLSYPDNPSDQRQRLAAGQTYYWKVEGLDLNGNAVAASEVAYSFTVQSASLARDLAVGTLSMESAAGGQITFQVLVHNQGGTSESNLPLKFSLGGIPAAGSPVQLPVLTPGQSKQYSFTAALPSDQGKSLAIACIEFFDDNVANNCQTVQVERPKEDAASGDIFAPERKLSRTEMLDAICKLLQEKEGLQTYDCVDPGIPDDELEALLKGLQTGLVDISYIGAEPAPPPPAYIPPPISAAPPVGEAPTALPQEEAESELAKEWRGLTIPLSPKVVKLVVRSGKEFKRLWRRINDERTPEVDFKRYMVIGVVAGGDDRAYKADIEEVQTTIKGMVVRFRLAVRRAEEILPGTEIEKDRSAVPYHLKVVPTSGQAIDFSPVEVKPEPVSQPKTSGPENKKENKP
ncbi:MAG: hypothetical protein A2X36_04425 [Elusimicrobia bacterium GWA2_69_24]|nr:MAG: hypothetical protein A2X36_04425 [Elusimicrobia bacterium GWA2_69_24]HBL19062.1 hypothetical protein [Elusimicrobiota bacterium]